MIDAVGGFVQHNLIVLIACVILPFKWAIPRLCGDREGQRAVLLGLPSELCYVALGIILGDVTVPGGAFRRHFSSSAHLIADLFVVIAITAVVPLLVHRASMSAKNSFEDFAATLVQLRMYRTFGKATAEKFPSPNADEMSEGDLAQSNYWALLIRSLFFFALAYGFQLCVTIWWLSWIGKVIAGT